ncbi:MAG: hypothetical protein FRX48_06350 [Lasallia pustulata]|uniref:Uncharacterized protein n=1 Tax=Lasallia pustulata TaxID=136370 RepID=A0A5M8PLI2_9LECA|nr:MAG: hypothetical protein FRX48_06350 [Lasallia pustulata]
MPMPSDNNQSNSTSTAALGDDENQRSGSPTAPPFSPITPVFSSATPAQPASGYGFAPPPNTIRQPPPVPISQSDNPDAIALRSAISILQIQRLQSLRDLKTLEKQKQAAVANPEAFVQDLVAGKVKSASTAGLFNGTLGPHDHIAPQNNQKASDKEHVTTQRNPNIGTIPCPQNVVRCPPINWAKYHIIGEALNKLHEEQRARPAPGEPQRDEQPARAAEHVVAAPYRPWADKVTESPMRTRSVAKKGSGS